MSDKQNVWWKNPITRNTPERMAQQTTATISHDHAVLSGDFLKISFRDSCCQNVHDGGTREMYYSFVTYIFTMYAGLFEL